MQTDKMKVRVDSVGAVGGRWVVEESCECTVDEFVAANEDGLDDVALADICHMSTGDTLRFGGGAAPLVEVTRVS